MGSLRYIGAKEIGTKAFGRLVSHLSTPGGGYNYKDLADLKFCLKILFGMDFQNLTVLLSDDYNYHRVGRLYK